jgi:hypothetical protein
VQRRNWPQWKKTVMEVPVVDFITHRPPAYVLEPRGSLLVATLAAQGKAFVRDFPEHYESILILETTGSPRRVKYRVDAASRPYPGRRFEHRRSAAPPGAKIKQQ